MTERRLMRSDDSTCKCGCPEAIVRVRGNAFAVTCIDCRASAIVPMLAEPELIEAFGESDEIAPVVQLKAAAMTWAHALDGDADAIRETVAAVRASNRALGVEFRLPTP